VQLASGDALDYDYVIYAVGSTAAAPAPVPGVAEFAYSVVDSNMHCGCAMHSTTCTQRHP
jgi:NADH dehydrogenase FAD-containing subunit